MIKDVMVCLEGTAADDVRAAAVEIIAGVFNSHVIGLFLNTVPATVAVAANGLGLLVGINMVFGGSALIAMALHAREIDLRSAAPAR